MPVVLRFSWYEARAGFAQPYPGDTTISRALEAMDGFSDRQLATVERFLSAIIAATEG